MSYQNEPAKRRQTYKLGYWQEHVKAPRRVVLWSAATRRIYTPRLGDLPAMDFEKSVPSLDEAVRRVNLAGTWLFIFEPVSGGWE